MHRTVFYLGRKFAERKLALRDERWRKREKDGRDEDKERAWPIHCTCGAEAEVSAYCRKLYFFSLFLFFLSLSFLPSFPLAPCSSRHAEAPSAASVSSDIQPADSNGDSNSTDITCCTPAIAHLRSRFFLSNRIWARGAKRRRRRRKRKRRKRTKNGGQEERERSRARGNRECEMYQRIPVLVLRRF